MRISIARRDGSDDGTMVISEQNKTEKVKTGIALRKINDENGVVVNYMLWEDYDDFFETYTLLNEFKEAYEKANNTKQTRKIEIKP